MTVTECSSSAQQRQKSVFDLARAASIPYSHLFPRALGWDHFAYPTPLTQVEFDPLGMQMQTHHSPYFELVSLFEPKESDTISACLDVVNSVLQVNDESPGYPILSSFGISNIPRTTSPELYVSFSDVRTEMNSPTTTDLSSYTTDPTGCAMAHSEAGFLAGDLRNFSVPVPRSNGSLQFDEKVQTVGPENPSYTDILPSKEPAEELMYFCLWEDGPVCGQMITRTSLPSHLAQHGIQKKTRRDPTKCHWVGCKKGEINRESIVRHIREIHLGLKRPSKRVSEPYSRGTGTG